VSVERQEGEGKKDAGGGVYFFQGEGDEEQQCGPLTYGVDYTWLG